MSDKINIDELLKQELGNMAPEPPAGVWENVSSQVQLTQPASQVVNPAASVTKTALAGSKMIITSAVVAITTLGGFIGYKLYSNNNQSVVQAQHMASEESKTLQIVPVESVQETTGKKGVKNEITSGGSKSRKSEVYSGKRDNKNIKEVIQPVFANQPDKAMDLTDPLLITDQPVKKQTETAILKQSTDGEEQPLQVENNEAEEHVDQFEAPFIPNVFTPNVDGKNDEFEIVLENEILYDLKITDRKGNIVFESKDKNVRWQGINIYTGKICEEGMYVYAFKYQIKGMKAPEPKSGWINLRLNQRQ